MAIDPQKPRKPTVENSGQITSDYFQTRNASVENHLAARASPPSNSTLGTLIVVGVVAAVIAAPFLYVHHQHVLEDERAEENARRNYGDPSDPSSKAYRMQHPTEADKATQTLRQREAPKKNANTSVEHDMGCPIAAARLIKKMGKCGLESAGITEDVLCGKTSPIDSKAVRIVADSDDCSTLKAYLNISD
jgi:hypothetical protein